MSESALEQLFPEGEFREVLHEEAASLLLLVGSLLEPRPAPWGKRELFTLHTEADELESFLDDYGARWNDRFHDLTELVASVRGFALAGLSLEHLSRRLSSYGLEPDLGPGELAQVRMAVRGSSAFVRRTLTDLLGALLEEAEALGVAPEGTWNPSCQVPPATARYRLPRTLGLQELDREDQCIAELASRMIQAHQMLDESGLDAGLDPAERGRVLASACREEHARVFEATVHNLQSAYDTHIKNTRQEAQDPRIPRLRGHMSAALHLLEAVTQLVHFIERHESEKIGSVGQSRVARLVSRDEIEELLLETLIQAVRRILHSGMILSAEILAAYTDVRSVDLALPQDVHLHARPIALIVAVVNHHGTPVEVELGGRSANAGSILEVMILAGSNPSLRTLRFSGDSRPLEDLAVLFEAGLGERGNGSLPERLDYLF